MEYHGQRALLTRRDVRRTCQRHMIPVNDTDGAVPSTVCLRCREWLRDAYKLPAAIVLRYFEGERPGVDQRNPQEEEMLRHLRDCRRCREWVTSIVPPDMLRRQSWQVKYCCAGMFCAVEEPDRRGPRISFTLFRSEDPCWQVDGYNAFLQFCPWCGKRLPAKPFIVD
jgi:hypothetical protein